MAVPVKKHGRYIVKGYSAIQFLDEDSEYRVFEAIPDTWFTDATKQFCYWPPKSTSKSIMLSAVNCVRPDDSWSIYGCRVISGGHASYAIAFKVVREKCSQKYNTSSADDRIEAEKYRRKHPVLAIQGDKSFERVFSANNKASDQNSTKMSYAQTENFENSKVNGVTMTQVEDKSSSKEQSCNANSRINMNRKQPHQSREKSSNVKSLGAESEITVTTKTSVGTIDDSASSKTRSKGSKNSNSGNLSSREKSKNPTSNTAQLPVNNRSEMKKTERPRSRSRSSRSRSGSFRSRSRSSRSRSRSSRSRSRNSRSRCRSSRSRYRSSRSRSRSSRSRPGSLRSQSGSSRSRSRSSQSRSGSSRSRSVNSPSSNSSESRSREIFANRQQNKLQKRSTKRLASTATNPKQRTKSVSHVDGRMKRTTIHEPTIQRSRSSSRSRLLSNPLPISGSNADSISSTKIDRLMKLVEKNGERQVENERRLTRIEVTLNKTFILVNDLIGIKNGNMQMRDGSKNRSSGSECEDDLDEFDEPRLPIASLEELDILKKDLKNRRYARFLVKHERDFCTPSKLSTHSVTMTKYLNRFVSMDVRCELTLREKSGKTLMGDYKRVYKFLIDVIRAGYRMVKKFITRDEAHIALRTVWGRSRQYKTATDKKKQSHENGELKSKRSGRRSGRHSRRPH